MSKIHGKLLQLYLKKALNIQGVSEKSIISKFNNLFSLK